MNILNSAIEKNEIDWIITTSYYAKYFSFYALLARCGIKCEIHDCTIAAMKALFVDTGLISNALYEDIERSKGLRVDMQYYPYSEDEKSEAVALAKTSPDFVLRMREAYEKITYNDARKKRAMLR